MSESENNVAQPEVAAENTAGSEDEQEEITLETTLVDSGPCEKTLTIKAVPELLRKRYEQALGELCGTIQLPGFRRGKAPRQLVEKELTGTVKSQVKTQLLREGVEQGLEDVSTVGEPVLPDVETIEFDLEKELVFAVKVEVLPVVEPRNYSNISVERERIEISDEDVSEELNKWLRRFGKLVPVKEGHMEAENYGLCDVEVYDGENMVWADNGLPVDFPHERIGVIPVPGIAEKIIGMRIGDQQSLAATLDDTFPVAELANKEVNVKVKLAEIRKLWVPPQTDETAEKLGLDSIKELRESFRTSLEHQREQREKDKMKEGIADNLLKTTDFELPPRFVQAETDESIRKTQVNLLKQGFTMKDITQMNERIIDSSRESVLRSLKLSIILGKIAEAEKIYVTEAEISEYVKALAQRENMSETNMERALEKYQLIRTIRSRLREDKVYDYLLSKADIKEATGKPDKEGSE